MKAVAFKRKGFTLIELLVAMAVIGVLVAIILPVMQAAGERGRTAKCQSNLHQIGLALQQYTVDFDGLLPHEDDKIPANSCWYFLVDPYLESRGLDDVEVNEVKMCPGVRKAKKSRAESYRMNSQLETYEEPFRHMSTVSHPSATVGIFDGETAGRLLCFKGRVPHFSRRHQKGGNILFLDWHVKWYSKSHVKSDSKKDNPQIIWNPEGSIGED